MEPASITLTRDELLVFLSIMGVQTMNGLDDDPLAGLSEAEIEARLNGGEQSLLNRGLITFEGKDNVTLDDTLVALVGGSVVPDATFLLTQVQPNGQPDPHYFNATPELLIEHFSPRAGVYTFAHLPESQALVWRVQTLLAPLHPLPGASNGTSIQQVPAAVMTQFMESCRKGDCQAAGQALTDAGCPADVAHALAEDCASLPGWVGVVAWGLRQEQPEGGDSCMALMGQAHCWLVENVSGQPNQVRIRPASGAQCEDTLVAMLQPLQQVWRASE